jgi:hypothetical protein
MLKKIFKKLFCRESVESFTVDQLWAAWQITEQYIDDLESEFPELVFRSGNSTFVGFGNLEGIS